MNRKIIAPLYAVGILAGAWSVNAVADDIQEQNRRDAFRQELDETLTACFKTANDLLKQPRLAPGDKISVPCGMGITLTFTKG